MGLKQPRTVYYGGTGSRADSKPRRVWVPVNMVTTMLRSLCIKKVSALGSEHKCAHETALRTPRSENDLASMIKHETNVLHCPFGEDFEMK